MSIAGTFPAADFLKPSELVNSRENSLGFPSASLTAINLCLIRSCWFCFSRSILFNYLIINCIFYNLEKNN